MSERKVTGGFANVGSEPLPLEDDEKELNRIAAKWGFDSMKDLAGAMLDGEIENTEDIERLRSLAKLLRTFSKAREKKLAALEQKRREDVRKCKDAVKLVRHQYIYANNIGFRVVMQCEEAIRAAFPEVFNES